MTTSESVEIEALELAANDCRGDTRWWHVNALRFLARRGLVEHVTGERDGWSRFYRITEAGQKRLAELKGR